MNYPHSPDAEKAVLGAIFLDNGVLKEVVANLKLDDFYQVAHRRIYAAMIDAGIDGGVVDAVTVAARLSESARKEIGGVIYLSTLADNIGVISGVSDYIQKVKEFAVRRSAIVSAHRIIEACEKDSCDPSAVMGYVDDIKEIENLGCSRSNTVKLSSGIGEALNGLKRYSNGDTSGLVPIGIKKIDRAMRGGMIHGALYLIGAPSGAGKTTLLQSVAINCARTCGPVLFVSPEMATWELSEREIISRSGYSMDSRGPWVRPDEQMKAEAAHIRAACEIEADGLDVHCIDNIDIGMSEICSKAMTVKNIKLVIIDYAQEVADMNSKVARYLAVGDVGKDAIRLGKDLSCPVLIASQVNVLQHGMKKEYSFRESAKLYHKAHCAMIMEVKRKEEPNKNGYFDVESANIFAMKNRSGPMFNVQLSYDPAVFRIGDYKQPEPEIWTPGAMDDGY